MVVKTEGIGATPTNSDTSAQAGVHEVQSGETLGKIALGLARDFGMPVATPAERRASIRSVLTQIYQLNPKFNPELESDGTVSFEGWNPDGVKTQDPDAIMRGEKINIPTERPPATETTDRDRVDTERHSPESIPAETTNAANAISPEAVNRERTRTTENAPATESTENAPSTEDAENVPGTNPAATENAAGTEDTPEEEPSKFEKVFSPIRKLFKNPIFQGLMALLNLIPGLNVIVSGVCAIIGLTNIISKIAKGEGMDVLKNPLELGSTLAYMAGVFMPGLGAIGGLMGMLQSVKETGSGENRDEQAATGQRNRDRTNRAAETDDASTPASERIPSEQLTERTRAAASQLPDILTDESRFLEWMTEVGRLRQEHNQLAAPAREAGTPEEQRTVLEQIAQANPGFRELTEFFHGQLPNAVAAQAGNLAFDLGELRISSTPQAGKLCRVPETMTIADYARTVPGFEGRHQELARAIASYNGLTGLRPDEPVPANHVLFVPPSLPAQDREWPSYMPRLGSDPYGVSERLDDLYRQLRGVRSDEAALARQFIELVLRMPTPRTTTSDGDVSDQPPA